MNYKKRLYSLRYIACFGLILFVTHCKSTYKLDKIHYEKNQSIDDSIAEDTYVNNFIAPYKATIDTNLNEIIAIAEVDLTDEGLSSNLGNLLADAVLQKANEFAQANGIEEVDIAVLNHGGMRVDINEGEVSVKKVYEMMPFENVMVLVKLKGKDLDRLIDYMLESKKGHPLSGIVLEYENGTIKNAIVNGKPIDPEKIYTLVTNNYLYNGGDKMDFFKPNFSAEETEIKIRDIFIEVFKEMKNLPNIEEQRLIIK